MSRTTVAINSICDELDKISGLTEYVSPLVEGINKQVKETVDLVLAFEGKIEEQAILEVVIDLMAEELSETEKYKGMTPGLIVARFKTKVKKARCRIWN